MSTKIQTWEIQNGNLKEVESTLVAAGRREFEDLESWIASNPSIVGPDLVVIGRQVQTRSGPLDLLAVDRDGNLVVIELKRDLLPREALTQAIDYAADIAEWTLDRIGAACLAYRNNNIEDVLGEAFPDIDLEALALNETQRVILVGLSIAPALERMIGWLSSQFDVTVNAVLLNYIRTSSGDELLTRTAIVSEETEQDKIRRRKNLTPMSDEPGSYDARDLAKLLRNYLSKDLYSARRIRDVLLPVCLESSPATREVLKEEFVQRGQADNVSQAGSFLSLISQQIGMERNDFLRQVIGYEYPNNPWEKDNYFIREGYADLVADVLEQTKAGIRPLPEGA